MSNTTLQPAVGAQVERGVRPDVAHVMAAVWNLYAHAPNFDGRQSYVIAAIAAAIDRAVAAERERCAAVARRWGETHADGETVNARNAASKIARGIEGPNV